MEPLVSIKNSTKDFDVIIEVVPAAVHQKNIDIRQKKIQQGLASVEERMAETQNALDKFNDEIGTLTNSADGLDYMVAVASGAFAGIVDMFFVEDFSLAKANEWGINEINDFVKRVAKKKGYEGDDLAGAVKYMEGQFPHAADKAINAFGGGLQHHLRDFSHHPTFVGLFFSLLTQFTNPHMVFGTDVTGKFSAYALTDADLVLIGKNVPEKITFGVINWFFHMVSDVAGSSTSILNGKSGTGLPGPIVSLLKEVSALPIFHNMNEKGYKEFSVWISKLFNGTLLGERDENGKIKEPLKFDLRTEVGVAHQLSQQAMPVIINECIVRGFYFIRHLIEEIKAVDIHSISDLIRLNWKRTLPYKNRTVTRMLTISTGTMTAIDLADAAIESAIKSGGLNPAFVPNMLVKVSFVGVGRCAIAVTSDVTMGLKREKMRNQRIALMNEQNNLMNSKTFYKQAEMWIAAENASVTIMEAYSMMDDVAKQYSSAYTSISDDLIEVRKYIPGIKNKNAGLLKDMNDTLKWGF